MWLSGDMANPSISVDDEVLLDFDDVLWALKTEGVFRRGTSRSEIIQQLMEAWSIEQYNRLDPEQQQRLKPEQQQRLSGEVGNGKTVARTVINAQ